MWSYCNFNALYSPLCMCPGRVICSYPFFILFGKSEALDPVRWGRRSLFLIFYQEGSGGRWLPPSAIFKEEL
jgi:hypothetical protein